MTTSTNLTISGGTRDLTFRRLLPALYTIDITGKLPEDSRTTIIGRRDYDGSHHRQTARDWVKKFTRLSFGERTFSRFSERIDYCRMDFFRLGAYHGLNYYYRENDIYSRTFCFVVAPHSFSTITEGLKLVHGSSSGEMILEKPFGENLAAAAALSKELGTFFGPEHIYHIGHYFGKEMVRNVQAIRFSNPIFTGIWNSHCTESVRVPALEDMGAETRGKYYNASGTLKDMVQNHLFQILSIMAMEQSGEFSPKGLHDAQPDVFHCLQPADELSTKSTPVLGQYEGYRGEPLVEPDSQTEIYGTLWLFIDSQRWKGTPFHIRTGKGIGRREIELVVMFRRPCQEVEPNILIIKIQLAEGVYLQFNVKRPGDSKDIIPTEMDFCQNYSPIHQPNIPEAYERLITACMTGEHSWFSQQDQIEFSWDYISHLKELHAVKRLPVYLYRPGARGSAEADRMLEQYGHSWLQVPENSCRGFRHLRQL